MKTLIFELKPEYFEEIEGNFYYELEALAAFGISYSFINISGIMCDETEHFEIINEGKTIKFEDWIKKYLDGTIRLYIYYFCIKDYSALFPKIKKVDQELATRLGDFYREAEISFTNECWLTYVLMCAAIYEGILYFELEDKFDTIIRRYKLKTIRNKRNKIIIDFINLIRYAEETAYLTNEEAKVIHFTRECRNLVHANNYEEEYITRKKAVEIMVTMDKLINRKMLKL